MRVFGKDKNYKFVIVKKIQKHLIKKYNSTKHYFYKKKGRIYNVELNSQKTND